MTQADPYLACSNCGAEPFWEFARIGDQCPECEGKLIVYLERTALDQLNFYRERLEIRKQRKEEIIELGGPQFMLDQENWLIRTAEQQIERLEKEVKELEGVTYPVDASKPDEHEGV